MAQLKSQTFAGLVALLYLTLPQIAFAQAWVPLKGEGSVNFAYQKIANTGHRFSDGSMDNVFPGRSTNMGLYIDADYAVTDRLSFAAGIPFVFGKYTDPGPTPGVFLPVDQCRCWNSGWQDFNFTTRYNLVSDENVALTPSFSFGAPSHDYDFRGEAALGRHLMEARLGIDAGTRLDFISPRLSVQGGYSYAFVERSLNIRNDRSNVRLQAGYLLTRKLLVQGLSLWQRTHGGLRIGTPADPGFLPPGEINTGERLLEHDRLLQDNNWRFGGGTTYSFEKVDVFWTYVHYAKGSNTHTGGSITVGISVPFSLGGR